MIKKGKKSYDLITDVYTRKTREERKSLVTMTPFDATMSKYEEINKNPEIVPE